MSVFVNLQHSQCVKVCSWFRQILEDQAAATTVYIFLVVDLLLSVGSDITIWSPKISTFTLKKFCVSVQEVQ